MTASTRTTAARLQIKDGYTIRLIGGDNPASLVGPLPAGAQIVTDDSVGADAALIFAADKAQLDTHLGALGGLAGARTVWVCYPKGNKTDINRDTIWPRVQDVGWKLVGNVSIDETWSALRIKPA